MLIAFQYFIHKPNSNLETLNPLTYSPEYWFLLHRKSNIEYFYYGLPGEKTKSTLIKTFKVNTGIKNKKPTPLPQKLGREYWLLKDKWETKNPETAPYFLMLDVPISDEAPFGPTPYEECNGQCNWETQGYFGLHGVNKDENRLSDAGSSGCVRHSDQDITYLFNTLELGKNGVRYYIEDI